MILAIILVLGFLVRVVNLNQSLWLDEAASLVIAKSNWQDFINHLRGDFHPPLYYLLLKAETIVFGNNEVLLRLPGVLIGVATIFLTYKFTKQIVGTKHHQTALIAAFFVAINPLHVYYSQELRMYGLNTFLSLATWIYLMNYLRGNNKSLKIYSLLSFINVFTFYGSVFNTISQLVYLAFQHRNLLIKVAKHVIVSYLPLVLWLPILVSQLSSAHTLRLNLPTWGNLSGILDIKSLGLIFAKFTIGRTSLAHKDLYLVLVVGIILYFALSSLISWHIKESKVSIYYFYIPILIACIFSLFTPMMGYWRFLFLVPAYAIIFAEAVTFLDGKIMHLNLVCVSLVFVIALFAYYQNPFFQREQWRGAAALINRPDSLTIINFPEAFAPLKIYAPDQNYLFTQKTLGKIKNDLESELTSAVEKKNSVFYLDYLSDLTNPNREGRVWLTNAGFVNIKTHNFPGVGFVFEYAVP